MRRADPTNHRLGIRWWRCSLWVLCHPNASWYQHDISAASLQIVLQRVIAGDRDITHFGDRGKLFPVAQEDAVIETPLDPLVVAVHEVAGPAFVGGSSDIEYVSLYLMANQDRFPSSVGSQAQPAACKEVRSEARWASSSTQAGSPAHIAIHQLDHSSAPPDHPALAPQPDQRHE